MHIGVYRAQQQGYGHLTIYLIQRNEERGKTTWGKYSLKKGQGNKFETCLQYVFIFTLMILMN